ncbi:hypothetical protein C8024_04280, partial [Sphingopyxis sp. BSNA05]|uniref:hypothetical protein n=1 Tax=Sphingopyxis sp. BSNA05 TaxID=1236614 RepID=UPI00156455BA
NRSYRENFAFLKSEIEREGKANIKDVIIDRSRQIEFLSQLDAAYTGFSNVSKAVIDVSTFPRDRLLIAMNYLRRKLSPHDISIAVTSPGEYATERDDGEQWLSRGVKRIEPVIGFNGHQRPHLDCLLILQLGHEYERPKIITNSLEPDLVVILGQSKMQHNARSYGAFIENNATLLLDLQGKTKSYCEIGHHDWMASRDEIARIRCEYADTHNVFIAPNGTKEQLLGAFGAALAFPDIQIIYAEPQRYNFSASSGIGGTRIVMLSDIVGY